jgi:hypothetical protein
MAESVGRAPQDYTRRHRCIESLSGALLLSSAVSGGTGSYDIDRPMAFPRVFGARQRRHRYRQHRWAFAGSLPFRLRRASIKLFYDGRFGDTIQENAGGAKATVPF